MTADQLKAKIQEVELQLTEAQAQAESLPELAGIAAANNDNKKSDEIFNQAETAALNVRRHTATLSVLKQQYAEQKEIEKQIRIESELKETEKSVEKQKVILKKKLDALIEAWNELAEIQAPSPRLYNYSGSYVLGRFVGLSNFRGGMNDHQFIPATKIINPDFLEGYTSAVLNSVKIEIRKEA